MATDIILIPDIFFNDWDGPKGGQAWLCLRPMVRAENVKDEQRLGDLVAFTYWATHADGSYDNGIKRFEYLDSVEAGLMGSQCTDKLSLLPINLPSDVDLEVTVARGPLPGKPIVVSRSDQCRVLKDVVGATTGPQQRPPSPTPAPFVRLFNEEIAQLNLADPIEKAKQVFAFMQRMEAGKNIAWRAGDVQNPYPIDVLDFGTVGGVHQTSLYWFLGLMFPLGLQKDLSDLQSIDRIDIRLLVDNQEVGELHIPRMGQGTTDADAYFSKIGVNFSRTLGSDIIPHDSLTYAAPGLLGLQAPSDKDTDKTLWRAPRQGARTRQLDVTDVEPPKVGQGGLARLAAIQIRAKPNGSTPQPLPDGAKGIITFTPGVEVSGQLKPYRRFPEILSQSATDKKLCTVMNFTADADSAYLLDALWHLESKNYIAQGTLSSAFSAVRDDSWSLFLLHAGQLPWDGPQIQYKVLAIPKSDTDYAAPGQPATWAGGKISLFIPAVASGIQATSDDQSLLWQALPDGGDAQKVQDYWKQQAKFDGWLGVPINCISFTRGASPLGDIDKLTISALWLDDFSFHPAESTVHLEKILVLNTSSDCSTSGDDFNNPARDYEDDLVNYNTAQVRLAGSGDDLNPGFVFRPQKTRLPAAEVKGGLTRQQTIPITHGWPREPRDEADREKLPSVGWRQIRDFMGRQYGLPGYPDPDVGPYVSEVEHTYGATLSILAADRSPRTFTRSRQIESPVWLPTFVEHVQQSSPFLTWRYQQEADPNLSIPAKSIVLDFDLTFLTPQDTPGKADAGALNAYTVACSAWRSLAELASAASINLEITPASYDLSQVVQDGAEKLAKNGFSGDWSREVRAKPVIPLPAEAGVTLKNWAARVFAGDASVTAQPLVFFPAGLDDLASHGDLVQLRLAVSRSTGAAPAPAAKQTLIPICQQPGDFRTDKKSLRGVWGGLGFGPDVDTLTASTTGVVGQALTQSHANWTADRTQFSDSVTPAIPPDAAKTMAESALISALPGSDWTPTDGKTSPDTAVQVEPVLLPLGFAPCAPDSNLGVVTQTALQGLAAALRDTIDLAFTSWVVANPGRAGADAWKARFSAIAALAQPTGDGEWTGKLAAFADSLTKWLLFPQPKVHPANDSRVTQLATDIRERTGDLQWTRDAVKRMLLRDPALFKDAKALLLTSMGFHLPPAPTPPAPSQPLKTPPTALARARFHRVLNPGASAAGGVPDQSTTVVLGADDLILGQGAPVAELDRRLAFLESLDDVRYANEFLIPMHGALSDGSLADYSAETYRGMVDPTHPGANGWATAPIVVPLAAENAKTDGRTVHLASRDLLGAPDLRWSGLASDCLRRTLSEDGPWNLAELKQGYPDPLPQQSVAPPPADLDVIATTSPPNLDFPADQALACALYAVRGDEEASVLESLLNDSFFVTIRPPSIPGSSAPSPAPDLAQQQLRTLLYAARGSTDAADAVSKLVLDNDTFETSVNQMIRRVSATPPDPSSAALIRVLRTGRLDIANGTGADTMRLLGAKLLAQRLPAGVKPNPVAYLFVAFQVDVWAPVEMVLSQARNFPGDGWPDADPDRPRFSDEFWQVAPQSSPPTRVEITHQLSNGLDDWRAGHVVRLAAADWRGKSKPLKELVQRLLFSPGVGVGDHDGATPLLAPGTKLTPAGRTFRVAVFQQQFDQDVALGAPTAGRFFLSDKEYSDLETAAVWFPNEYSQFSVDFQWFADSGLPLLRIERIYIDLS